MSHLIFPVSKYNRRVLITRRHLYLGIGIGFGQFLSCVNISLLPIADYNIYQYDCKYCEYDFQHDSQCLVRLHF